jgi:hypothetical protein
VPAQPNSDPGDGEDYDDERAWLEAEELEDGSRDPDELSAEPEWWDEGALSISRSLPVDTVPRYATSVADS